MKVNWDDEIPNMWENKNHVPVTTNQQPKHPFPVSRGTSEVAAGFRAAVRAVDAEPVSGRVFSDLEKLWLGHG